MLQGIISGGADKELKFWSFDLVKAERSSARTLSLALDKSVVMEDGILAAVVSKDAVWHPNVTSSDKQACINLVR